MTPTPRYRLEKLREDLHLPITGPDAQRDIAKFEAEFACAIENIEAMDRLAGAVKDMANRSEATSIQSGKVARGLNWLTLVIAFATIVQAGIALYTAIHR